MKKWIKIIVLLIVVGILVSRSGIKFSLNASTVRAFGDLMFDFHVPTGSPLFNIINLKPGDEQNRNIDVKNNNTVTKLVTVKGIRTQGTGNNPKLETSLEIFIKDGSNIIYGTGSSTGSKNVSDFFADSVSINGIGLGLINPNQQKTYNFHVIFPSPSGNEYQSKSVIFDLIFDTNSGNNLVINEVYYLADYKYRHDIDSPKDSGFFRVNDMEKACDADVKGKEKEREKEKDLKKRIEMEKNDRKSCEERLKQNNEWTEIYNPTNNDVSLKDWSLTDNSNSPTIIHANVKIKSNGFALIAKNNSTWKDWNEGKNAVKIELGSEIGDGLDNSGDHLILKNNKGVEVDRMSWGSDISGFTPLSINPVVSVGSSTERVITGYDTNKASDWMPGNPPTPGK
jgi:hypothetical protein